MLSSQQWFELSCRQLVWHNVVTSASNELPRIRDIRIQSNKLRRLLDKDPVPHASPLTMLAGKVSMKKYRKKQLQHTKEVSEQRRKFEAMTEKSFKEWLRHKEPMTNAEFRQWWESFNKMVDRLGKEVQQRIVNNTRQLQGPFGQIGKKRPLIGR